MMKKCCCCIDLRVGTMALAGFFLCANIVEFFYALVATFRQSLWWLVVAALALLFALASLTGLVGASSGNSIQVKVFAWYLTLQALCDVSTALYTTITGFNQIDDICGPNKGDKNTGGNDDDCEEEQLKLLIVKGVLLSLNALLKTYFAIVVWSCFKQVHRRDSYEPI